MYIRFQLPLYSGDLAAGTSIPDLGYHWLVQLKNAIAAWAKQHNVRYSQKTIKGEHRVTFDSDEIYTLFSLTWMPKNEDLYFNTVLKYKSVTVVDQYPNWARYEMVKVAGELY